MFCEMCGTEATSRAKYCENCGTQLAKMASPAAPSSPPSSSLPGNGPGNNLFRKLFIAALALAIVVSVGIGVALKEGRSGNFSDPLAFPVSAVGDLLPKIDDCVSGKPLVVEKPFQSTLATWVCIDPSPKYLWESLAVKAVSQTCFSPEFQRQNYALYLGYESDLGSRNSAEIDRASTTLYKKTGEDKTEIYETFKLYPTEPSGLNEYKSSPYIFVYFYPLATDNEKYISVSCYLPPYPQGIPIASASFTKSQAEQIPNPPPGTQIPGVAAIPPPTPTNAADPQTQPTVSIPTSGDNVTQCIALLEKASSYFYSAITSGGLVGDDVGQYSRELIRRFGPESAPTKLVSTLRLTDYFYPPGEISGTEENILPKKEALRRASSPIKEACKEVAP